MDRLTPQLAADFIKRYALRYFIETGIGQLDSRCYHIAPLVAHAWGVDISPESCRIARDRAAAIPNLTICEEPSQFALQRIVPTLAGPCLYFLDAHWNCDGPAPEIECPLIMELGAISLNYRGDAILIDDARQFLGTPTPPHDPSKWPTFAEILQAVNGWPGRPTVRVDEDWIVVEPEVRQ